MTLVITFKSGTQVRLPYDGPYPPPDSGLSGFSTIIGGDQSVILYEPNQVVFVHIEHDAAPVIPQPRSGE